MDNAKITIEPRPRNCLSFVNFSTPYLISKYPYLIKSGSPDTNHADKSLDSRENENWKVAAEYQPPLKSKIAAP